MTHVPYNEIVGQVYAHSDEVRRAFKKKGFIYQFDIQVSPNQYAIDPKFLAESRDCQRWSVFHYKIGDETRGILQYMALYGFTDLQDAVFARLIAE